MNLKNNIFYQIDIYSIIYACYSSKTKQKSSFSKIKCHTKIKMLTWYELVQSYTSTMSKYASVESMMAG
jgi:hypothetical protein